MAALVTDGARPIRGGHRRRTGAAAVAAHRRPRSAADRVPDGLHLQRCGECLARLLQVS